MIFILTQVTEGITEDKKPAYVHHFALQQNSDNPGPKAGVLQLLSTSRMNYTIGKGYKLKLLPAEITVEKKKS